MILAEGKIVANGTADQLAKEVSGKAEVRWEHGGKKHVHATKDGTEYVRKLLAQHKTGISELEVRRASLEDTYLAIVQKHEGIAQDTHKQGGAR